MTIALAIPPEYIQDCDCSLCGKLGVWWGYFTTAEAVVRGTTQSFQRSDRAIPAVDFHFCPTCGCATHWTLTPAFDANRMGVNMRLFEQDRLAGIELRFPDGAGWDGVSDFGYRREPIVLDGISH